MPSLSEHQYEQREKLIVARSYAMSRIVQNNPPPPAVVLYSMVGDLVNMWLFSHMSDASLDRLVDHCRQLIKSGHETEWLFHDHEGRRANGIQ